MITASARPVIRTVLTALCISALPWIFPGASNSAENHPQPGTITIRSEPVPFDRDEPRKIRFGKLKWLGTVRLTSPSPFFGGYSGLVLDSSGTRMLAISDKGTWLSASLVYGNGRVEKLMSAKVGRLRGLDGKPFPGKFSADSESIVMEQPGSVTGVAYVSFERRHRIAAYPVTSEGFGPPTRLLKLPGTIKSADANKGIEAMAILRAGPLKGALLAFTEEYLDARGDYIGWLVGGPKPGRVTLRRYDGFAITDMTSLPGGDVIVLERRFRFSEGVKMRLRRIALKDIKPGAQLDGDVLLEADDLREIDNMEGLAAHVGPGGRTILTLISDDNFNRVFQRTLLMQFAIVE